MTELDETTLSKMIAELATQQAEANRLKNEELRIAQQLIESKDQERRQFSISMTRLQERHNEVMRRYVDLAERVEGLIKVYEYGDDKPEPLEQAFEALYDRVFDLEQNILDLTRAVYALMSQSIAELRDSRQQLRRNMDVGPLLAQAYRNLQKLQEQAALHGAGDIPLELSNKIEREQQRIDQLRSEKYGKTK